MKSFKQLQQAKRYCEEHELRLTEPRQRVLEALLSSKKPLGAYEVLQMLSSPEHTIKPPTVYRAIEFWLEHGFVHKLESLNAYMACCQSQCTENFCIFICKTCQTAIELVSKQLPLAVRQAMSQQQLVMTRSLTEIHGYCRACHAS